MVSERVGIGFGSIWVRVSLHMNDDWGSRDSERALRRRHEPEPIMSVEAASAYRLCALERADQIQTMRAASMIMGTSTLRMVSSCPAQAASRAAREMVSDKT